MVSPVEYGTLSQKEWVSKLTGGFAEPWTLASVRATGCWPMPISLTSSTITRLWQMAFWICNGRAASGDDHSSSHHPGPEGRAVGRAGRLEAITCPTLAFFSVNAGQSRVTTAPYCDGISGVGDRYCDDFGVLPSVIRVVPNGVDTSLFRPLPQIRRDPQQIVATASADAPLKGLHVLLRAFKQLREERPQQDWCSSPDPNPVATQRR